MALPFAEGELALFVDSRGRRYLQTLRSGRVFQTHLGFLPHEKIIGLAEGTRLRTNTDREVIALRPTLMDYVMNMPRNSQIIYPKDTGAILLHADIFPGATVIESGIGSGALTLSLLRAVGPEGKVAGYEVREDLAEAGLRNVRAFHPGAENLSVRIADVYQGIEERDVDRIVLDLPEPWRALDAGGEALRLGGILLAYVPTVLQVHKLHQAVARDSRFDLIDSFEVLHRPWHFSETSARPAHRMVAHTGFITTVVRCEPGRRGSGRKAAAHDVETEGDLEGNVD